MSLVWRMRGTLGASLLFLWLLQHNRCQLPPEQLGAAAAPGNMGRPVSFYRCYSKLSMLIPTGSTWRPAEPLRLRNRSLVGDELLVQGWGEL